ncbi:MAG TPA: 50S ribosomal protein L9 [Bacteroidia bacterium]|nr:50S ribosomal protein L9 [Bacteroidia bacterium]HRS58944.1 50S ribosomal protein L9 [Bacteroidia bacterium]HRU67567.1 50S ribosomal protein L9 [Bacteroidia bacterium]
MEVILKVDVEHLGSAGEIVNVKPGYARNYLLPKQLAILATESNKKMHAELQKQARYRIEKELAAARETAEKLAKTTLKLPVKVGTTGKLFGSITNLQVARVLKDLGYDIDRKNITFLDEIKELGKYRISVKINKELSVEMNLNVVRDEEKDSE